MTASIGITPEWLATTRADPVEGTCARPRIRTRNQRRYSPRAAGISTARLNSGSNPDSGSTSKSPTSRRRTKSAASLSRLVHPPGSSLIARFRTRGQPPPAFLPILALSHASRNSPPHAPHWRPGQPLLLIPALNARLAQQLAVLLLRHPLAPFL